MSDATAALGRAIPPARVLGLETGPAEAVLEEAQARLGLTTAAWVLALVGGTGVGKSSLVNALAGSEVSAAGARRPTTGAPVAWLGAAGGVAAADLEPLLARLGARRTGAAPGTGPAGVAAAGETPAPGPALQGVVILDLPDLDSVALEHRRTVDSILPRVDAVAWVTDPEKYADGLLHDELLRRWLPRLQHQVVVVNKADRLRGPAAAAVASDLANRLAQAVDPGAASPPVIVVSAAGGADGIADLRRWIEDGADAKAIVAARLEAAARAELGDLAAAAAVRDGFEPLLPADDRGRAIAAATDAIARVLDLDGTRRRAVAASRESARRGGTGPIGWLTSGLIRLVRPGGPAAEPAGYLADWRSRGQLTAAAEAVRASVLDRLAALPAPLRARYAAAIGDDVDRRLSAAADGAARRAASMPAPRSRWWPLLGLLQSANQLVLLLVAAWLVAWFVVRPAVPDVILPIAGPVPAPLAILAASLLAGYLLARLLALHAGWIGGRWATRLLAGARDATHAALVESAFEPHDRLEDARREIANAWAATRGPAAQPPGRRGIGGGAGPRARDARR